MPKFEYLTRRRGGSKISLGAAVYHFTPDAEGRHVADVSDPAHVARLREVRRLYRELPAKQAPKAAEPEPKAEAAAEPGQEAGPQPAAAEPPAPVPTRSPAAIKKAAQRAAKKAASASQG